MNINVIGRRGLGKSTLAQWRAMLLNRNIAAFDPGDQYEALRVRTSDLDDVREAFEADWDRHPLSLAYIPPSSNIELEWDRFAATIWRYTGKHEGAGSYVLIVDECDELQSPQTIDEWLNRFIRRAPRREKGNPNPVDLIQTTHNPQDLHRTSFSQADEVYIFNMFDARAVEAIRKQWGDEVAAAVQGLKTPKSDPPGREVIRVDPETGGYTLIDDPSTWFVSMAPAPASRVEWT